MTVRVWPVGPVAVPVPLGVVPAGSVVLVVLVVLVVDEVVELVVDDVVLDEVDVLDVELLVDDEVVVGSGSSTVKLTV
ncbi:MAG: hypothetical protein AB7L84_01550, partial [Acidimicrobiia bacterium]